MSFFRPATVVDVWTVGLGVIAATADSWLAFGGFIMGFIMMLVDASAQESRNG